MRHSNHPWETLGVGESFFTYSTGIKEKASNMGKKLGKKFRVNKSKEVQGLFKVTRVY